MTERVAVRVADGVCTISLNRPEALNALENSMIAAVNAALDAAEVDDQVRAILIRGEGRAFCAGDDLIDMGTPEHPEPEDLSERYTNGYPSIVLRMLAIEKPIVVAVRKYGLGAGFEIALAADLIVAEPTAKFGLPFVLRGIAAGTSLLPKRAPAHLARRLLFLGDMITATEAHHVGIVATLSADGVDIDDLARDAAARLASSATRAIGLMKRALGGSEALSVVESFGAQVKATVSSVQTADFAEGKLAFTQKRPAEYQGN
ncbi:enoyl-CoA hydratase/isomerase family protein [Leucobacter sp. L43]|uniref:enoyl-CoA hydratase/isomerase family protein n=1 Tax=Leucobacter sp. L43 TaxID=2798040 RepID=UPI001903EB65|nr:enoyl-CoA hydratase-related protein [Leucobacter sp. L43]